MISYRSLRQCILHDFIIVPAIKTVTGGQATHPFEWKAKPKHFWAQPRENGVSKTYPKDNTDSRVLALTVLVRSKLGMNSVNPASKSSYLVPVFWKRIQKKLQIPTKPRHISVSLSKNIQKNSPRRYIMVSLSIYWCVQALSWLTKWWAQNEEVPVNWHWCAVHPKRIYKDGWRYY